MPIELVTVKYGGEFRSIPIADLDIGDLENPTDPEVRSAVAAYLGAANLDELTIERDAEGKVLNLRPSAQYGILQEGCIRVS